jgi:hypothetical protein
MEKQLEKAITREYECPHCHTILTDHFSATIEQQLSASGDRCEECINELDTPDNRQSWLYENDLFAIFLEWHFSSENEITFGFHDKEVSKMYVDMYFERDRKYNVDTADGELQRYINAENAYNYHQWLMATN